MNASMNAGHYHQAYMFCLVKCIFIMLSKTHLVAQGFHFWIAFFCQKRKQLEAVSAIKLQNMWWEQYSETTLDYVHSK